MGFAPGENCFRRREIVWLVDIEKRIKWLDWPIDGGAAIIVQKFLCLAHVLFNESLAQFPPDRDRPERGQRMRPPARARASNHGVVFGPRVLEAGGKIVRKERRIGRHADCKFHIRAMRGDP